MVAGSLFSQINTRKVPNVPKKAGITFAMRKVFICMPCLYSLLSASMILPLKATEVPIHIHIRPLMVIAVIDNINDK